MRYGLKAAGDQERLHVGVRLVEHVALPREVRLGHGWHVLFELVAKSEEAARSKELVKSCHLSRRLVPKVEDVIGYDDVDRRHLGQRPVVALNERKPVRSYGGEISLSGLREHLRRKVGPPHLRPRKQRQDLLQSDAGAGAKFDDPCVLVGAFLPNLT